NLLVPAEAEIVVEGYIDTEYLEPEAPFGESHGHVNLQEYNAFMEVTCITRRKNAILTSIISQVTPSESSLIKRVALEPLFTHDLPRESGTRPPDPPSSRPGARPEEQAKRRRRRFGADRRDDEGGFPPDLAAQARVHGAREGDLGGAGPAEAQARVAMVRLHAR